MNDSERVYKGVPDWVRTIMRREGPLAFYKGFGMCWARVSRIHLCSTCGALLTVLLSRLKLGLHTVLTFIVFEQLRLWFGVEAL